MFKDLLHFLNDFRKRDGLSILIATLIARLFSFLNMFLVTYILNTVVLGRVSYGFTILTFIIPLAALGLPSAVLRYGATLKNPKEKDHLIEYLTKTSFKIAPIIFLVLILVNSIIITKDSQITKYIYLYSLLIFSFLPLEILKVKYRIHNENRKYGILEILNNSFLLILIVVLSYLYGGVGYIVAYIISPILSIVILQPQLFKNLKVKTSKPKIVTKEFWNYGFFASLTSISSQFLFGIDIVLIQLLLEDPSKTGIYKVISQIPFSLLILSRIVLTTDFVKITQEIENPQYIKKYIKNYIKIFVLISIISLILFYSSSKYILKIYPTEYQDNSTFNILIIAVLGYLVLKSLFDNLLSALGEIKYSYYVLCFSILLNASLNFYMIPKYGIQGAAITTALTIWINGVLSCVIFYVLFTKKR